MMEVAIISLLPEEVDNYYLELRQELEERFGLEMNHTIPAHITFKYGFPVEDLSKVAEVVRGVCSNHPRPTLQLDDFGSFHHRNNPVAFIDCIPTQGIRDIHEALFEGLRKINWVRWGEFDITDLHYHVTIASNCKTSEEFELVWSFLRNLAKPHFELQLDNLALFRTERDPPLVSSMFRFTN